MASPLWLNSNVTPPLGGGMLLPELYRWFQTQQQIISRRPELVFLDC